jgi:hypothetical protein
MILQYSKETAYFNLGIKQILFQLKSVKVFTVLNIE